MVTRGRVRQLAVWSLLAFFWVGVSEAEVVEDYSYNRSQACDNAIDVKQLNLADKVWGIDVSHHQQYIDWHTLAQHESPDFVFVKATEGSTYVDPRYYEYWQGLQGQSSIVKGIYHFFSYSSAPEAQAENFIQNVKLQQGDLPPVLDIEWSRRMPSDVYVTSSIIRWLQIVEAYYGVKPILYLNHSYFHRYVSGYLNHSEYPLWVCDFKYEPSLPWIFWQMSNKARLRGIATDVDLNVFRGSRAHLEGMCIGGGGSHWDAHSNEGQAQPSLISLPAPQTRKHRTPLSVISRGAAAKVVSGKAKATKLPKLPIRVTEPEKKKRRFFLW